MHLPAIDPQDRYQVLGLLGEGGLGQVFEAWDARLCRRIAIKRLKASARARPEGLWREARAGAALRHDSFVKIYALEGEGALQMLVMELVEGITLDRLARQGAPAPAVALDIVGQVAEAMAEAHAAGIIHGDIKPANLMVEPSGRVRILDFGEACRAAGPAWGGSSGTIPYLAPECLAGARPSAQGDIYSLGVVLYQLITGQRPFAGLAGLALAAAQLQSSSDAWPFPRHAGRGLRALVRAMTARSRALRLDSMGAVRQRIAALGQRPRKQGGRAGHH